MSGWPQIRLICGECSFNCDLVAAQWIFVANLSPIGKMFGFLISLFTNRHAFEALEMYLRVQFRARPSPFKPNYSRHRSFRKDKYQHQPIINQSLTFVAIVLNDEILMCNISGHTSEAPAEFINLETNKISLSNVHTAHNLVV